MHNKTKGIMKQPVKKLLTIIFLIFGLSGLHAQETVSASGGEASGSGGLASYTIGQLVYTMNTGTTGSVTQGVQQPYEISVVTGIPEAEGMDFSLSVYPNPASDFVILKIDASTPFGNSQGKLLSICSLWYQLYDNNGKLLKSKNVISEKTQIATNDLTPAIYFLKIIEKDKIIKNFKIIKNY